MPATIKAAAAAARVFASGAVGVPLLAGGVVLEKKVIKEKAELEAKKEQDGAGKPKELPSHQMPSAPRFD